MSRGRFIFHTRTLRTLVGQIYYMQTHAIYPQSPKRFDTRGFGMWRKKGHTSDESCAAAHIPTPLDAVSVATEEDAIRVFPQGWAILCLSSDTA